MLAVDALDFVIVFLASFIAAPVNAYYTKLADYSETVKEAILWFTTIIPAILLIVVGLISTDTL